MGWVDPDEELADIRRWFAQRDLELELFSRGDGHWRAIVSQVGESKGTGEFVDGLDELDAARKAQRRHSTRQLRTARADIRDGLLSRHTWLGIVIASTVVVMGHLAMFMVAARTAGATAPLSRLVPLTLLALLAMGLPANIAGFGPREGVAAWAFGAAGLTQSQGVATAVVYGALVLASSLPGAAVLVLRRVAVPREGAVSG